MSWRKFVELIRERKALRKLTCAMTAATFCVPYGMAYAAQDNKTEEVNIEKPTEVNMATETSMFDRVPVDSWVYKSINDLIATGKVPRYKNQIKPGATFTRFELALITTLGITTEPISILTVSDIIAVG